MKEAQQEKVLEDTVTGTVPCPVSCAGIYRIKSIPAKPYACLIRGSSTSLFTEPCGALLVSPDYLHRKAVWLSFPEERVPVVERLLENTRHAERITSLSSVPFLVQQVLVRLSRVRVATVNFDPFLPDYVLSLQSDNSILVFRPLMEGDLRVGKDGRPFMLKGRLLGWQVFCSSPEGLDFSSRPADAIPDYLYRTIVNIQKNWQKVDFPPFRDGRVFSV